MKEAPKGLLQFLGDPSKCLSKEGKEGEQMGNRGFGSGGRGVIQTSICPINDCILKCSRQGGIRTAARSIPKALALEVV